MLRLVHHCGVLAIAGAALLAQTSPHFEAADVHPSPAGTTQSGGFLPNGRAEFRGVTLLDLASVAYNVPADRISGGLTWLATDRFDVVAKAPAKANAETMRSMLRALLTERFDLSVKQEEKPLPVYALVVKRAGAAKSSPGDGDPQCNRGQEENIRTYTCRNTTMQSLAERLPLIAPAYFDKPVVDRTGLKGAYDFKLEWLPRGQAVGAQSAMTIFPSIEKQLGVALEPQTAPMPVLSVERANRTPTPNAPNVTDILGAAPTEFEVATIKPSRPDETPDGKLVNGTVDARALSLKEMIAFAYDVEEDWVKGGEKWVETDRFDVLAKTAPTASADTLRAMLQALLADRFALRVHKESQPVTVYALTAPKPKLKQAAPASRPGCKVTFPDGVRTLTCTNTTMAQFAERLRPAAAGYLDHPVVDLTGLTAAYDFSAAWLGRQALLGNGAPPATDAPQDRPVGMTLFEALDKQLGLKLAPQKHPMPVLVIDHATRKPSEN